ncbi:MAG: MFS transporter [Proteobacteria bacterium]|nr:MFS transporter [Pseudomonadota bacterium]
MKTPKNIWALGWVSFFTDMAMAMLKPLIPIYVVYVLNQGIDQLGYVLAVTTFVSYALRWLGGWLSDRFQVTKPLLVVGYGISTFANPLFAIAQTWVGVAAVSSLERLGKALRAAPKDVLIAASANQSKEGRAFSVHKTLDIAGEALGGLIAFLLLTWLGSSAEWIQQIFYWSLFPGLVALFILVFVVEDKAKQHSSAPKHTNEYQPLSTDIKLMLGLYFIASFFMINESFVLIRAHDVGFHIEWLPLLVLLGGLIQTFVALPIGKQLDNLDFNRILIIGLAMGLISLLLMLVPSISAILAAVIFQGVFSIALLNSIRVKIAKSTVYKGYAYGVFYAGTAIATALGAVLTGWIWKAFDANSAILLAITGTLVTLLVLIWQSKRL